MIHYNVWFSFNPNVDVPASLGRVRKLLEDFKSREMIADYRLLKNRGDGDKTRLPPFQAIIEFRDNEQFALPFAEVEGIGIHKGTHGAMIEHVNEFVVEVFEQL
jgi:uncharacterized protein DUF6614